MRCRRRLCHPRTTSSLPQGISERLISLCRPLRGSNFSIIISAYVPTMTGLDEGKTKFNEDPQTFLESVPKADKLIFLDDFNARVGTDHTAWRVMLCPHGIVGCNENGLPLLLLRTCAKRRLLVANTFIRLLMRIKAIWITPDRGTGSCWNLFSFGGEIGRT
ncbi:hypothetical protein SprV_0200855800 [Sparganum proliferum]